MSSYWKAHYDSLSKRFPASPLKQVGKTVNGQEVPRSQLDAIVQGIANALQLTEEDALIDLCCGNGLITRRLAGIAKEVVGVDFSPGLIDVAESCNSAPNIEYINSDVLELTEEFFSGSKRVSMYEALQHLSLEQFVELLNRFRGLQPGALVFLGSIPNEERLAAYYDSEEKLAYYEQREREGKPHMGRWWSMEEIERILPTREFEATFLSQNPTLYTASYRFDLLLERHR